MMWYDKLLLARRDRELSQRQLADKAKTNHVQISRIEKGEQVPKIDMFYRICKALNVSMDYILKDFEEIDSKIPPKSR